MIRAAKGPCPAGSKCCDNPGGRWEKGPDPGEAYPYFGKPCKQQSDCAQCSVDGTCTCEPMAGQQPPMTGCCKHKPGSSAAAAAAAPSTLPTVTITYEMYQGLPAMSKKVLICNIFNPQVFL